MKVYDFLILASICCPLAHALRFKSIASLAPIDFSNEEPVLDSSLLASPSRCRSKTLISTSTSNFVTQSLRDWGSIGLSLAVIQRDEKVVDPLHPGWRIEFGSYGVASTDTTSPHGNATVTTTKPITLDTLFAIASNSKLFLSISVGLLVSNKTLQEEFKRTRGVELSWRTRMRDVLGEDLWRISDEDIERGATIQDLLGHRTGLPRHDFSGVQRKGGVEEMIRTLKRLRPSATFRETFQYNNLMYETLSHLPSLLLNQSYESYIADHLFHPLNMASTTFSVARIEANSNSAQLEAPDLADRMAQGHLANTRDLATGSKGTLRSIVPYFMNPGEEKTWAGAGGVISSARDLATWTAMLLNEGKHPYTNKTVVPKEVWEWVSHGRSVATGKAEFPEFSPFVYGAALFSYTYRGTPVLEHGGNNPGFKSQVARFPKHNLGIVSLSNDGESGGFILEATKWRVVDELVFGAEEGKRRGYVDWIARYAKLWAEYGKGKKDKAEKARSGRGKQKETSRSLGKKRFVHEAYSELAPCRIPPSHLGLSVFGSEASQVPQTPLSFEGADSMADYENPHINCTAFLALASTRRILSTLSPSSPSSAVSVNGNHDPIVSLYISPFIRTFATHMLFSHYSGSLYNISIIWTNDDLRRDLGISAGTTDDDEEDAGAMLIGLDETFTAEYAPSEGGLAIRDGFWGKEGVDSREPDGWGKEGAEVWFQEL